MKYVICDVEYKNAHGHVDRIDEDVRLNVYTTTAGKILRMSSVSHLIIGRKQGGEMKYIKKHMENGEKE